MSISEIENERIELLPARTVLTTFAFAFGPRHADWGGETNNSTDRKSVV